MLVTEKVANGTWCQETFQGTRAKCVGPKCMAWRWSESIPHVCTKCGTEETEWKDEPDLRRGFCGLAGIAKW
jgi:hypothetical protein